MRDNPRGQGLYLWHDLMRGTGVGECKVGDPQVGEGLDGVGDVIGGADGVVDTFAGSEGHFALVSVFKGLFGDVLRLGAGIGDAEVELDGVRYGAWVSTNGFAMLLYLVP